MLDEVVERRGWISREHFLHLIGVTNLLPGPNSSEVTIHIGYIQRGWTGALATGLSFLVPTFLWVTLFAWLYFSFGSLPQVEPVFWGLKPVIVAIILSAGIRLGRTAVKGRVLAALAALGAAVAFLAGGWAVVAMAVGGALTWTGWKRGWLQVEEPAVGPVDVEPMDVEPADAEPVDGEPPPDPGETGSRGAFLPVLAAAVTAPLGLLGTVFLTHLWIGAVLFGGGYALVALLEPFAVGRYGWLTSAQFLDGVALTQAVPGPISTLAAFVGFSAGGLPGAFLATAGVYLPAFAAVLLVAPHLERLRSLAPVKATLDGVSAVVAGVIVGVAASLVAAAVPDVVAGGLAAGAFLALVTFRIPAPWVVLVGLLAGLGRALLGV